MPRPAGSPRAPDSPQARSITSVLSFNSPTAAPRAPELPAARPRPRRRRRLLCAPGRCTDIQQSARRRREKGRSSLQALSRPLGHQRALIGAAAGPGGSLGHYPRWSSYRNCNTCRWCPSSPPVRRRLPPPPAARVCLLPSCHLLFLVAQTCGAHACRWLARPAAVAAAAVLLLPLPLPLPLLLLRHGRCPKHSPAPPSQHCNAHCIYPPLLLQSWRTTWASPTRRWRSSLWS